MSQILPWFYAVDHLAWGAAALLTQSADALTVQSTSPITNTGERRYIVCDHSGFSKSFTPKQRVSVGVRLSLYTVLSTTTAFVVLRRTTLTNAIELRSTGGGGTLRVVVNGVNYDTSFPLTTAMAYYEVCVYAHATEGIAIVNVNGDEAFRVEGINTGAEFIETLFVAGNTGTGAAATGRATDLYIREAPTEGNPFYGPILLRYLRPVSDDTAAWTPTGTGTGNWGRVADASGYDGNASYIETQTLGDEDVYNMEDLPAGVNSIIAVVPLTMSTAPSGGAPQVELSLETAAGVVSTGTRTVGVSNYQTQMGQAQTEQPGGGGWSIAAVDELKLRVKAA
jgi:hypothetical protein